MAAPVSFKCGAGKLFGVPMYRHERGEKVTDRQTNDNMEDTAGPKLTKALCANILKLKVQSLFNKR